MIQSVLEFLFVNKVVEKVNNDDNKSKKSIVKSNVHWLIGFSVILFALFVRICTGTSGHSGIVFFINKTH